MIEYLETQKQATFAVALIFLTCAIALAYNIVHAAAIKLTSATTTTVIGQAKILLLLFLSALLLGERDFFQIATAIGGALATAGIVLYALEKIRVGDMKNNVV